MIERNYEKKEVPSPFYLCQGNSNYLDVFVVNVGHKHSYGRKKTSTI